jgi:type IV secretion system protein VirB1
VILPPAAIQELAQRCAPAVEPATLVSVAAIESGFDALVIGVNGARRQVLHPASAAEAEKLAVALIARGADVDLGLGQINSRNLGALRLSVQAAFDPCANLAASGRLLQDGYARASRRLGRGQAALLTALSLYNTGDDRRGFRNGYVARVLAAAGAPVPRSAPPPRPADAPPLPEPPPEAPALDVFARPCAAAVF